MPLQPPHDADTERRLLLAMVLSMAVLFLAPYFYRRLYPPPPPMLPVATETAVETATPPPPLQTPVQLGAAAQDENIEATEAEPRRIILENENLSLGWNSRGGVLESARLKGHRGTNGEPLETLPQRLAAAAGMNLGVRVGEEALDQRLAQAVYELRGVASHRERMQAPLELTFYYRDADVEVTRRVELPAVGYTIQLTSEVRLRGRIVPHQVILGPGIGPATATPTGDFENPQLVYFSAGSTERQSASDLEAPLFLPPSTRWVAQDSKYFTYLLLDPEGLPGATLSRGDFALNPPEEAPLSLALARVEVESGRPYQAFIGPKDYELLGETDGTLVQLIDYGWFAFLVKPLLFSLKFFFGYTHNYGWAIILLTFIINLALFPVRYKQMASMKKMSELQPQLKSIQDKYKKMKRTDPRRQKMNEEVMALYKANGVNPLGGCLPLVIQMPFLFAFYRMLYSSIELRGAPFIGWIHDLSRHDPYYVTPILMGVTMVIQQKMTPATGDPTQRKMMMMLPVVFTFFFLNFSSGLVVYFLFSNLFGMIFQAGFQRLSPGLAGPPKKLKAKGK